jgi:hypothetical protein
LCLSQVSEVLLSKPSLVPEDTFHLLAIVVAQVLP